MIYDITRIFKQLKFMYTYLTPLFFSFLSLISYHIINILHHFLDYDLSQDNIE